MGQERVEGYAKGFTDGWNKAQDRAMEIIKSHIQSTYPINCKSIIEEIENCGDNAFSESDAK